MNRMERMCFLKLNVVFDVNVVLYDGSVLSVYLSRCRVLFLLIFCNISFHMNLSFCVSSISL